MTRALTLVFFTLAVSAVHAQPATTSVGADPIPPEVLAQMYRAELGKLHTLQVAPKLAAAHQLVEEYFSARAAERKELLKKLEATGLDPAIIGRLCRIRMHWPGIEGGIYYINERVGPHAVMYFIGVPKTYDRSKPCPLVIKLPGAHAFVGDPRPSGDEVATTYQGWMKEELDRHPDALVMMPLLNLDELYGPSTPGMNTVIQPLHHAAGRFNIDPARVYLLGQGMAAHATWNLALHYPTYFAAINPLAGGVGGAWQRIRLVNLRNVLTVVWHDSSDQIIKVNFAREPVNILRKHKFDVEYEETNNVGHAPSEEIAERQYQKMRARTRLLYPPEVVLASNRPESMFNRNDWVQVYQMLNAGPDQRMRFQHGSGLATISQNSYSISTAVTGQNRVEVASQNVESFRLFLNDQMLDLSRPVTVIVNKKPRFEGKLKQSIDEMMKDQLALGRGWRYYTAVVDIDFGAQSPATRPTTRPATRPR